MFYILAALLIFFKTYAYDISDLLKEAQQEINKEESQYIFRKAIHALVNKDYKTAVKSGKEYLKLNKEFSLKTEIIYETLAISYYRLGIRELIKNKYLPYIKQMEELLKEIENKPLSRDAKLRIFISANNLFIRKKQFLKAEELKNKFKELLDHEYFFILDPDYEMFIPNVNIFKISEGNLFGKNEVYISEKNQTLIEIAKKVDMGYDEMRLANKYLNPNDIKKGEAVFIPRKRLIPVEEYKFGEIYLNLSEKRLYYPILIANKPYVITIPVGIGTDENKSPIGDFKITEKRKNPEWRVPKSIREENPDLPEVVSPGPDNPLGTRAMRLGYTSFLMHGTSKKFGIGMKVSHGCIRMYNKDVEKLFEIVKVGTPVHITEKDYKIYFDKKVFIEVFYLNDKDIKEILNNNKNRKIDKDILFYTKEERKGYATPLE